MYSYNDDHSALLHADNATAEEDQRKNANMPSVYRLFANMWLPKADESRLIQSMNVLIHS